MPLLGCSVSFLKKWLERQFKSWMNWDNYGTKWHIDHVMPLARFDLTQPRQQYIAFHYTNLQPLSAKLNCQLQAVIKAPQLQIPFNEN